MELRFRFPSSLASGVSGPVLRPVTRAIRSAKAPCGTPAPSLPEAKCCCTACCMAAILGFSVGVRGKSCSGHTNHRRISRNEERGFSAEDKPKPREPRDRERDREEGKEGKGERPNFRRGYN